MLSFVQTLHQALTVIFFFFKWQTEERLYKINSGIILHVWFLVIFPKERVIHSVG